MSIIETIGEGGFYPQMPSDGPADSPSGLYSPVGPAAPTTDDSDPIASVHATFEHVAKHYGKHLDSADELAAAHAGGQPLLTQQGADGVRRSFADTPAAKQIEQGLARTDFHVAQAEDRLQQVRESLKPADDTASQLKATRDWARIKSVLDGTPGGRVVSAARAAVVNASADTLPVLAEEISAYLESRGAPAGFIGDVLAAKVPELAEAQRNVKAAHQARSVIQHNASVLTKNIRSGQRIRTGLLDPRTVGK